MTRSKIRTSGAEGLTLSSTSLTVANGLTLTDGDVTVASGHGVSYAATSDGGTSTPDELLDDYEEGTWTPTLLGDSGQSGQAYGLQQGRYTKTGRQVSCMFFIRLSDKGTFTGTYIRVGGFPFTISTGVQTVNLCDLYFINLSANYISLNLQAYENSTTAYIWSKKSATASREYLVNNELGDTSDLSGSC